MSLVSSIIFDLDGTLVDSSAGILSSFHGAFENVGLATRQPLTSKIVGPPLMETLTLLAGTDEATVLRPLAEAFKAYYDMEGYRLTSVFPGIEAMLAGLVSKKIPLYVATNKRLVPTQRILEYLGWGKFFSGIYALDSFVPSLGCKADVLTHIVLEHNLAPASTIYVGDRYEDGEAAMVNDISFALALWGYGGNIDEAVPANWTCLAMPEALLGLIA